MRPRTLLRVGSLLAIGVVAAVVSYVATGAISSGQQGPPTGPSAHERAERFQPGPLWDGKGKGRLTQADLESFADYPLVWVGESVGGYNLQAAERLRHPGRPGSAPQRPVDTVTFIYGLCTPQGEASRCAAPVTVHVEPVCTVLPQHVADGAKMGPLQTIRGGAQMQRFGDGSFYLWTGSIGISIVPAADPALGEQAVQQLRGIGRLNADLRQGQSLPAPDFSGC